MTAVKLELAHLGFLTLTPDGIVAEPQVAPEECVVDEDETDPDVTAEGLRLGALHRRGHVLNRILRDYRAQFEREAGGDNADYLRWLATVHPDGYQARLVEDAPARSRRA